MAPVFRSVASDIQVLRDPRRPHSFHLVFAMLGFLAAGLLAPFVSIPRLSQPVYLSADGRTVSYSSHKRTVEEVLKEVQVAVGTGDRVTPALGTAIWPGIQITVTRALPLSFTIGGVERQVRLPASTVGEALSLLAVETRPEDRILPDPSTVLTPGMRITVERREMRRWIERASIPFATQAVFDRDLFKGQQIVRSAGQPGVQDRTVQAEYADGRVVALHTIAEAVVQPPAPRVVAVGTRPLIAVVGPFAGKEIMTLEATAYYPGPNNYGGPVGTRTAIGMVARRGVVAVDPSVIKLGTRLHVDGYGDAVAGDTGGAIRGYRIDLCFDTYEEAIRFGRHPVKVYILSTP